MKWSVAAAIGVLCLAVTGAAWAANLERVDEVWRSPGGSALLPGSPCVNQSDGSVWVVEGQSLVHFARAGEVLGRASLQRADFPLVVADTVDGSCWLAPGLFLDGLAHVASDGTTLSTTPLFGVQWIAVSPFDGSVWAVHAPWDDSDPATWTSYLSHVSATGEELARLADFGPAVVDPVDGSAWGCSLTSTVRWRADGTQVWSAPYAGSIIDGNPRDQSVWLIRQESETSASVITHLSAHGEVMSETTGLVATLAGLHVSHVDGSVWVQYMVWGEYDYRYTLVHLDASGAQVGSLDDSPVEAYNDLDGSLWVGYWGAFPSDWQLVQYSSDLQEMNRFARSGDAAYDQAANTFWQLAYGDACELQRVGPDGTVLWSEPIPLLRVLPQVPSPQDGSVWIDDYSGTYARYSPEGVEVERGVSFPGLTGRISCVLPSPVDGSRWVAGDDVPDVTVAVPTLIHLSSAGDLLSTHSGAGLEPRLDERDGSVWITQNDSVWDGSGYVWVGHLRHFGADDTELLAKEYSGRLGAPLVAADGSVWVQTGDSPGGPLEHVSAAGELLGSLTPGIAGAVYVLSPTDGSFYFASDYVAPDVAPGAVGRVASDGSILWVQEGFHYPSIAVDPDDGSLWVADVAAPMGLPRGPAVIHYAADGTELWQGNTFISPRLAALDERDGSVWVRDETDYQTIHLVPSPFLDVSASDWAFDEVRACAEAGIVQGFGGGTYQPDLAVTRDAMAVYLSRALAGSDANVQVPSGVVEPTFSDVEAEHWAYRYIEYCAGNGLVQGYPGGAYHPDEAVNRGQMSVYIARAAAGGDDGVPPHTADPTFTDVTASNDWAWCYDYVEYCAAAGIVQGYWDGRYRPENIVTRDQMAVYVARAFALPM